MSYDTDSLISAFRGAYRYLSNFYVEGDGQTIEHRFQAAKALDPAERQWVLEAPTPGEAKRRGRKVSLRPDWEDVKEETMLFLLRIKFTPGSKLAEWLMATHPAQLQESNTWNDTYWGVDLRTGRGQNRLGELLMEIRSELVEFDSVKAEIADDTAEMWDEL